MSCLRKCPCCKQEKDLTKHNVKERNNRKIMICIDCHKVIEGYQDYIDTNLSKSYYV